MAASVCPRCGTDWSDDSLYCLGCGVTLAFLNQPADRGPDLIDVAQRQPSRHVYLAVLVGLLVLGGGFVIERARQVQASSLVQELLTAGLVGQPAEPCLERLDGHWEGLSRGRFRFAGEVRSPAGLRGPVSGLWTPARALLAYHYELRPEVDQTGPAALTFDGRLQRQGQGRLLHAAGGDWRSAGTMTGAVPKPRRTSGGAEG